MKQVFVTIFLVAATTVVQAQQKHKKPMRPTDTLKVTIPMNNAIKGRGDTAKYTMPVLRPDTSRNEQMPVVKPNGDVQPK